MFKKILVVGFILLAGSQSVYAQDAAQAAVNEAGHLRIVEIKNRVNSQREQIKKDLAVKTISADQARECVSILNEVEGQVALIAGSDGNGTMLAADFDSYSSFLDVNASLIDSQNQSAMVASKGQNPNS
jgi:hypothetical protein